MDHHNAPCVPSGNEVVLDVPEQLARTYQSGILGGDGGLPLEGLSATARLGESDTHYERLRGDLEYSCYLDSPCAGCGGICPEADSRPTVERQALV